MLAAQPTDAALVMPGWRTWAHGATLATRSVQGIRACYSGLRICCRTKLDSHKARIVELTGRYPDITAQRIYEILLDEGADASHSGMKRYVRMLRPPPRPTPSLPTPDYEPGEMSESDSSPYEVRFTTGKMATVHALSCVLVHSTRKYFGLYESNDLHALMDGHERAFTRFGACAAQCKYDSQKPVVLRWEGTQPIYNPRFLAFSSHYEFRPLAAGAIIRTTSRAPSILFGRSSAPSSTAANFATWTTCACSSRTGSMASSITTSFTSAPRSSASPRRSRPGCVAASSL